MEHRYLSILLTMLMSMMGVKTIAHDIEVVNTDGITIYYVWIKYADGGINKTGLFVSSKGGGIPSSESDASYSGNIVIPESVEYNGKTYSVRGIEEYAFGFCCDLTSVIIPNSLTSIGKCAFWGCSGLNSINIPNSVEIIGVDAFKNCSGLTSITIPRSAGSIGIPEGDSSGKSYNVFRGCSSLTSIIVEDGNKKYDSREECNAIIVSTYSTPGPTMEDGSSTQESVLTGAELVTGCMNTSIPNSVTSIGISAFEGCSGLISIMIPNSITSIKEDAFFGCKGITDVYCYAEEVPNAFNTSFDNTTTQKAVLHVPTSAIEMYSVTEPWSHFKEIVALEENPDAMIEAKQEYDSNEVYYNLTGRKVMYPQKGIYIKNCKKIIMK